jgi:2,3-bisphosphoglycerate-independent phosphoglycerate mutase
MRKTILIVSDGLGDRPIEEFKGLTPLEKAKTPNMDHLAKNGITGLCHTINRGIRPGSDTSHLSLLGYDPEEFYHGRGPFEAAGIEMELKHGDVAFRGNLGTVDKNLKILDRRAGRIPDTTGFIKELNGMEIDKVKFFLKPGTAHRVGIVMRGKGISHKVSTNDPHVEGEQVMKIKPLDKSKEAKFTASVLEKFTAKVHDALKKNPLNDERKKKGLPEGNYLLVRGAGYVAKTPTFFERYNLKAACIAGAGLYKGIAKMVGMQILNVKGATGLPTTDVEAKIRNAVNALDKYDFVFVHIKATDNLAEDGDFQGKKEFIEKMDKAFSKLKFVDALTVITADHSTACSEKKHTADPVPILIHGKGVRVDSVESFGERACSRGSLGHFRGLELMPEIINILGMSELYGA